MWSAAAPIYTDGACARIFFPADWPAPSASLCTGWGYIGFRFTEASGGRNLIFDTGQFLRLAGVAYEPTFLSFYLMTTIPVTLMVWLYQPTWLPRRLLLLSLFLQATAMLLTFSAGGWASLLVALALVSPLTTALAARAAQRRFAWALAQACWRGCACRRVHSPAKLAGCVERSR